MTKDRRLTNNFPVDEVEIYLNESDEIVKKSTSFKAIVLHKGKLLLVVNEHTGELGIPGGRSRIGETPETTINREFLEETGLKGITLAVGQKIYEKQSIFRSPVDSQWRDITYNFYVCDLQTTPQADFEATLGSGVVFYDVELALSSVKHEAEKGAIQALLDSWKKN